ncbi:hypothetical protein AAVH_07644 [Aphelenchoides avenae]|nr:hypothetical protein AAVH_07644 [Aphelenchus avenae]
MEEADFYGLPSLYDAHTVIQKEGAPKVVESVTVCKSCYVAHLKVTTTIICDDHCVLRELKSPRRGLEVQGDNGAYTVAVSLYDWKATMRTARDAILSCGLKLVKETNETHESTMEFSNA